MTTLDTGYRCKHKFIDLVQRVGPAPATPRRKKENRAQAPGASVPKGTDDTKPETKAKTTEKTTDELLNKPSYEALFNEVKSSRNDINKLDNKVDNLTLQIERMCELLDLN